MAVKININDDPKALVPARLFCPEDPFTPEPITMMSFDKPVMREWKVTPQATLYPDGTLVYHSSDDSQYVVSFEKFEASFMYLPEVFYEPGVRLAKVSELYDPLRGAYAGYIHFDCPKNDSFNIEAAPGTISSGYLLPQAGHFRIDFIDSRSIDPSDWSWTWQSRLT